MSLKIKKLYRSNSVYIYIKIQFLQVVSDTYKTNVKKIIMLSAIDLILSVIKY